MTSKPKTEELLLPAAADRASGVRSMKSEEKIIINRPDRSTHPDEKSVQRIGATPSHGVSNGLKIGGPLPFFLLYLPAKPMYRLNELITRANQSFGSQRPHPNNIHVVVVILI